MPGPGGEAAAGHVELRAYAELNDFLPPEERGRTRRRAFRPHQTVKDVIEAAGIPHTEVDLVVVGGEAVGFDHRPAAGDRIAVYPVFETLDIGPIARLRPASLRDPRFVVDVHLGRLARLLRLVGFDARWANDLSDDDLVAISRDEHRIVLTRDRGLLKRRVLTHGLFVRGDDPRDQAVDVLHRLDLGERLAPFTRCPACGAVLVPASKEEVVDRLLPRTRQHYDDFHRCPGCGRVYWRGAHHRGLAATVDSIRAALDPAGGG